MEMLITRNLLHAGNNQQMAGPAIRLAYVTRRYLCFDGTRRACPRLSEWSVFYFSFSAPTVSRATTLLQLTRKHRRHGDIDAVDPCCIISRVSPSWRGNTWFGVFYKGQASSEMRDAGFAKTRVLSRGFSLHSAVLPDEIMRWT